MFEEMKDKKTHTIYIDISNSYNEQRSQGEL